MGCRWALIDSLTSGGRWTVFPDSPASCHSVTGRRSLTPSCLDAPIRTDLHRRASVQIPSSTRKNLRMATYLYRLGRLAARRAWAVVLIWFLLLAGIGAANSGDSLGGAFRGVVNDAKTGLRVL